MLGTLKTSFAARPTWQLRVLRITFFVILTAIAAKIRIELPGNPVPITAQTLAVLLAGLALGPIEGAISQLTYIGLIATGMPIDARSLGTAALFGPTAGYLIGFVPMAFIAGFGKNKPVIVRLLVGVIGVIVVYCFGTFGVTLSQNVSWSGWNLLSYTVVPFILVDCGKALLAASLTKLGGESWLRWGDAPAKKKKSNG